MDTSARICHAPSTAALNATVGCAATTCSYSAWIGTELVTHSPRLWRCGEIKPADAEAFRKRRKELGVAPLIVHTPYLPNLCTMDEALYARILDTLSTALRP